MFILEEMYGTICWWWRWCLCACLCIKSGPWLSWLVGILEDRQTDRQTLSSTLRFSLKDIITMLFLALLSSLLQLAAAAPAADVAVATANDAPFLERRAGDGVHLVNCDGFGGEGTIMPPRSYVIVSSGCGSLILAPVDVLTESKYCPNDSDCNHQPTDDNTCTMSQNFLFTWEGAAQACTFKTGTRFAWFINADAQSQNNFVHVG